MVRAHLAENLLWEFKKILAKEVHNWIRLANVFLSVNCTIYYELHCSHKVIASIIQF